MYKQTLLIGLIAAIATYLLMGYVDDLRIYYLQLFNHPLTTDSIEAGPIKITLSNATEWSTVAKMIVTVVGAYAGIKAVNKYIK